MRKIINEKLYDTDKCEKIIEYLEPVKRKNLLNVEYYVKCYACVYKTKKGSYIKHIGEPVGSAFETRKPSLEIITADELKKILLELNAIDTYIKEFGEVEEG